MKNWSIGRRITAGFAVVIAISITLGLYAYKLTDNIEKSGEVLVKDYLPSAAPMTRVRPFTNQKVSALQRHIRTTSPAEMDALDAQMAELTKNIDKNFAEYEAATSTPEQTNLYAAVKRDRDALFDTIDQVSRLSRSGTAEGKRQAAELAESKMAPQLSTYSSTVQVLIDYSMSNSLVALGTIYQMVYAAERGIIVGLTLAVLVAIFITIYHRAQHHRADQCRGEGTGTGGGLRSDGDTRCRHKG